MGMNRRMAGTLRGGVGVAWKVSESVDGRSRGSELSRAVRQGEARPRHTWWAKAPPRSHHAQGGWCDPWSLVTHFGEGQDGSGGLEVGSGGGLDLVE